jgi:hypothetical protein
LTDAQIEALTDEEYEELDDLHPGYLRATEYLSRRELGLAPGRDELSARDEQLILFVASERQRQQRPDKVAGGDRQFAAEAEPEEQEVSDADLLAISTRSRGR